MQFKSGDDDPNEPIIILNQPKMKSSDRFNYLNKYLPQQFGKFFPEKGYISKNNQISPRTSQAIKVNIFKGFIKSSRNQVRSKELSNLLSDSPPKPIQYNPKLSQSMKLVKSNLSNQSKIRESASQQALISNLNNSQLLVSQYQREQSFRNTSYGGFQPYKLMDDQEKFNWEPDDNEKIVIQQLIRSSSMGRRRKSFNMGDFTARENGDTELVTENQIQQMTQLHSSFMDMVGKIRGTSPPIDPLLKHQIEKISREKQRIVDRNLASRMTERVLNRSKDNYSFSVYENQNFLVENNYIAKSKAKPLPFQGGNSEFYQLNLGSYEKDKIPKKNLSINTNLNDQGTTPFESLEQNTATIIDDIKVQQEKPSTSMLKRPMNTRNKSVDSMRNQTFYLMEQKIPQNIENFIGKINDDHVCRVPVYNCKKLNNSHHSLSFQKQMLFQQNFSKVSNLELTKIDASNQYFFSSLSRFLAPFQQSKSPIRNIEQQPSFVNVTKNQNSTTSSQFFSNNQLFPKDLLQEKIASFKDNQVIQSKLVHKTTFDNGKMTPRLFDNFRFNLNVQT